MRIVFIPEKYDVKSTEVSIPLSQEDERDIIEGTQTIKTSQDIWNILEPVLRE